MIESISWPFGLSIDIVKTSFRSTVLFLLLIFIIKSLFFCAELLPQELDKINMNTNDNNLKGFILKYNFRQDIY